MEEDINFLEEKSINDIEIVVNEPIEVFVKLNSKNEIVEIDSSVFLNDTKGWIKIDEGYGDKYAHAQSHYFIKPLQNDNGSYNYKLIDGQAVDIIK